MLRLIHKEGFLPFPVLFLASDAKIPITHSIEKIINPVRIPVINPG